MKALALEILDWFAMTYQLPFILIGVLVILGWRGVRVGMELPDRVARFLLN